MRRISQEGKVRGEKKGFKASRSKVGNWLWLQGTAMSLTSNNASTPPVLILTLDYMNKLCSRRTRDMSSSMVYPRRLRTFYKQRWFRLRLNRGRLNVMI